MEFIKADMHMHSYFSSDSDISPEEMARGAVGKGLEMLCFTDHYDKDDCDWGAEDVFDPQDYFARMEQVQSDFAGQIQVQIGVELGLQPYLADFYHDFVGKYPFAFVIGSVHSVEHSDIATGKIFEGRSDEEVYWQVLTEMLEDVRLSAEDFDVLGHLDYMTRYGRETDSYSYEKYADLIDEILRTLIEHGKGLELNTSGLRYGLSYAHPQKAVLKRYRELGGEIITVGADAHAPDQIAFAFDQAAEILEECGFKYYTEFMNKKPVFVRIGQK